MVWHLEKYSEIHSRICCLPHLTSSPPRVLYYICIPNIKGILLPRLCYMFPCITLLVALRVHPAALDNLSLLNVQFQRNKFYSTKLYAKLPNLLNNRSKFVPIKIIIIHFIHCLAAMQYCH